MEEYRFERIIAWRHARGLVKQVYHLLKKFPEEEKFALTNQIRRAVISVPSNIAEGCGRLSPKDQCHFYEMAYGSLMEVYCQLLLAQDLGYIDEKDLTAIKETLTETSRTLTGLRKKVESRIQI